MNENQLNNLAENIREEGYNPATSGTDLVYDSASGEFRTVPRGYSPSNGETVTKFTEGGFASESSRVVVYLREDELKSAEEALGSAEEVLAYVEEIDSDEVFHIHLHPDIKKLPNELRLPGFYTHDCSAINGLSHTNMRFCVLLTEEGPEVWYRLRPLKSLQWAKAEAFIVPSEENLFSRSKGILEVDILRDKRVLVIGLGSFGSQISIELAKAGVGHFALMDFDRVELHNLSRHTATVHDLGRLKTNVIEEAILGKNPYAKVDKFPVNINEDLPLLYEEVGKADLVICATDNNTSRFNISGALVEKGKVGIFGRAITRAEGGDVFRYRPGGPCYCCIVGAGNLQEEEISDVASARRDGRIAAYVSAEDAEAMVQVGLSSDIEPICNLMVKLALVELSRGKESGISSLEEELTYDCYLWANRRDRHYANWKPFPAAGPLPSILRWYGVKVNKDEHCPICSGNIVLDDGEEEINTMARNIDLNQ